VSTAASIDGDVILTGWVNLGDDDRAEVGDFSLRELRELRPPFGGGIIRVELDRYFTPRPTSKLKSGAASPDGGRGDGT
jgi:hypothetical protein